MIPCSPTPAQCRRVPAAYTIDLRADTSAIVSLLERLPKAPLEIGDLALKLPDQLFTIDTNGSAATAGELVVRLEPSEALLRFLAAAGALDGNSGVGVQSDSPVGLSNHRMTEADGAINPIGGGGEA